jgi:hypothetical protein
VRQRALFVASLLEGQRVWIYLHRTFTKLKPTAMRKIGLTATNLNKGWHMQVYWTTPAGKASYCFR